MPALVHLSARTPTASDAAARRRALARVAVSGPAVALLAALALPPLAIAQGATLSEAESARAESLARTVPWTGTREGRRDESATSRPDAHPLGVQTLAIERESRKGAPRSRRLARVYQHDHDARRSRRVRLDLATGEVLDARPIASPHLPLAEAERRWALERLAADEPLLERLRDEQRARGEAPFATLDALEVKAIVFEPDDAAHPCRVERCALLSLFDATRTVFATEPLVRFADGRVGTLDEPDGASGR